MNKKSVIPMLEDFFENYLPETKGASSNTIRSYHFAFRLFFGYLEEVKGIQPEKVTVDMMTSTLIEEFLNHLERERGCSPQTRNLRRAALRAFAAYAIKKNISLSLSCYSEIQKIPKKKEPKNGSIRYFSQEEVKIILSCPKPTTITGQRDITLLSVLYATGARAQELCDIKVKDITFSSPVRIKLTGKGNKSRVVTIPDSCARVLSGYMKSRGFLVKDPTNSNRYLFPSRRNDHMTISCVEGIVKKYLSICRQEHPDLFKEESYSPHTFRHSIAVHMLEAGDSLVTIKAFLGHASIVTTTIYAQVTPELANKYLDERGRAIDASAEIKLPNSLAQALPFLYR